MRDNPLNRAHANETALLPQRVAVVFTVAALSLMGALLAGAQATGDLSIGNAWFRATPPGASVAVAYFDIVNAGAADTLLAIECPLALGVEVHSTSVIGGVMRMRPSERVRVPAGGRVVFAPGGLHAMLIGLKRPLQAGQRIPLIVVFERAGRVYTEATVRRP